MDDGGIQEAEEAPQSRLFLTPTRSGGSRWVDGSEVDSSESSAPWSLDDDPRSAGDNSRGFYAAAPSRLSSGEFRRRSGKRRRSHERARRARARQQVEAIILGFQHYILALGTPVIIPSVLVPMMGGDDRDKVRVIQTLLFLTGINTLLQTLFGTRLPTVIGDSYAFVIPIMAMINDSSFAGITNGHEIAQAMTDCDMKDPIESLLRQCLHLGLSSAGVLLCPWAFLVMAIGLSELILGLWPMHLIWTYYCIIRTKLVGPVVKLLLIVAVTAILIQWLIVGIPGSILAGLVYGFLAPIMATFGAVGEGKEKPFIHCLVDGTWSTITGSCTVVRDVKDLLFHSYVSIMDDLGHQHWRSQV